MMEASAAVFFGERKQPRPFAIRSVGVLERLLAAARSGEAPDADESDLILCRTDSEDRRSSLDQLVHGAGGERLSTGPIRAGSGSMAVLTGPRNAPATKARVAETNRS